MQALSKITPRGAKHCRLLEKLNLLLTFLWIFFGAYCTFIWKAFKEEGCTVNISVHLYLFVFLYKTKFMNKLNFFGETKK